MFLLISFLLLFAFGVLCSDFSLNAIDIYYYFLDAGPLFTFILAFNPLFTNACLFTFGLIFIWLLG